MLDALQAFKDRLLALTQAFQTYEMMLARRTADTGDSRSQALSSVRAMLEATIQFNLRASSKYVPVLNLRRRQGWQAGRGGPRANLVPAGGYAD